MGSRPSHQPRCPNATPATRSVFAQTSELALRLYLGTMQPEGLKKGPKKGMVRLGRKGRCRALG